MEDISKDKHFPQYFYHSLVQDRNVEMWLRREIIYELALCRKKLLCLLRKLDAISDWNLPIPVYKNVIPFEGARTVTRILREV
jgi:hypothetical protein